MDKRFLSLSALILFLCLPGSGALSLETSHKELVAGPRRPAPVKEGDKKMEKAKWLSEDEGKRLLGVARNTIRNRLFDLEGPQIESKDLPETFQRNLGNFVTINIEGNLRGCIGHIVPRLPLIEGIRENAINAAFRDPRFPPLTRGEFDRIEIEISILTTPEQLHYADAEDLLRKLRPGIHGVIIKKGFHEATFLPQVWDQLPAKEDFLSHLCLKAGLSPDTWKTEKLEVSTYQVQAFEEERPSISK